MRQLVQTQMQTNEAVSGNEKTAREELVGRMSDLQTQLDHVMLEKDAALIEVQKKAKEIEDLDQQLTLLKMTMEEPQSIGCGDLNNAQVRVLLKFRFIWEMSDFEGFCFPTYRKSCNRRANSEMI
jgi:hypothetical protein